MNKYITLLLLALCFGCTNKKKDKTIEELILVELNVKYEESISFFGKDMVAHFPKKINDKSGSFTNSFSPELGNLELVLFNVLESNNISNIIKEFEDKSIAIYSASDSCLLVVNRFVSQNNHYKVEPTKEELQLVDKDCYSDLYPIPNFWHNDYTTDKTECKLPKDFTIYVLESKHGKFVENNLLTDGRFMPDEWKNGFSKGVAISKNRNVIFYWLIIW